MTRRSALVRNDVEYRLCFAPGAADDPQDFGGCRLASVSFVKFPSKLFDLSAKLQLQAAILVRIGDGMMAPNPYSTHVNRRMIPTV